MASARVSAKASWEEACLSINYLICNCPQESQFWFPLTWHISFDKCGRYSTHSHPDSKSRETNEAIQNGVTRSNLSVDQSCPTFWRMIWIKLPLKLKLSLSRCWILQKFHCTSRLQNQTRTICLEPYEIGRGIWLSPTAVLGYDG